MNCTMNATLVPARSSWSNWKMRGKTFSFASGEFLAQTSTHTFSSGSFLHAVHSYKRLKVRSMCTPANNYVRLLIGRSERALSSFGQRGPGTSHIKHRRERPTPNPHQPESATCLTLPASRSVHTQTNRRVRRLRSLCSAPCLSPYQGSPGLECLV